MTGGQPLELQFLKSFYAVQQKVASDFDTWDREPCSLSSRDNQRIWKVDPSGCFSVKPLERRTISPRTNEGWVKAV